MEHLSLGGGLKDAGYAALHAALSGGAEELCPIVAVRRTRVSLKALGVPSAPLARCPSQA